MLCYLSFNIWGRKVEELSMCHLIRFKIISTNISDVIGVELVNNPIVVLMIPTYHGH